MTDQVEALVERAKRVREVNESNAGILRELARRVAAGEITGLALVASAAGEPSVRTLCHDGGADRLTMIGALKLMGDVLAQNEFRQSMAAQAEARALSQGRQG